MTTTERIPTTRYAILGLVAAAPSTAYELAKRMRLTYAYFWPRARSLVFTEVKKLAASGWVASTPQRTGRRRSVSYAITPRGRRALRAWLATPPHQFAFEIEALLRLYLSRFGDDASLAASLASVEREASAMLEIADDLATAYVEGRPPPPADRAADRVILFDFFVGFARFARAWAERSQREVATWRSREAPAIERDALRVIGELGREAANARAVTPRGAVTSRRG